LKKLPLPFKGRVGVGVGIFKDAANPHPPPVLPLKGEGRDRKIAGDRDGIQIGEYGLMPHLKKLPLPFKGRVGVGMGMGNVLP
jgi:hypothetical protein